MKTKAQIKREYDRFIADTGGVCWRCGRTARDRPAWWGYPYWGPERAHIDGCNHPRKNDRRACVILDSLCHRIQHGDRFTYDLTSGGRFPLCTQTPLELDQLLFMKLNFDPDYFDPEFLAACSIKPALVLSICREIQNSSVRRLPDLETLKKR